MARILIFDSKPPYATKSDGSAEIGNQFALAEALTVASAKRSNPVRCFGGQKETALVGIEWLLDQGVSEGNGVQVYAFRWWPEYFNDVPSLTSPPTTRNWKGVNVAAPWGRGVVANDAGGGHVELNALTYHMNMTDRLEDPTLPSDCLYTPLPMHALWARVAIYCDLDASTSVTQDNLGAIRLRAYAIAGNHTEAAYLEENGDKIYNYNAYKS